MSILARILRDRGIVTEQQLQEAVQHQVLYGGRLGTSLFELGFITEERLEEALAKIHGVPPVKVDMREITPEIVDLVPKAMAARHKVFPFKLRGKTLYLLMVDPNDHAAMAEVGFRLGYIIRPLVVPEMRMIHLLRDFYGVDERWRFTDTHHAAAPPPLLDPQAAVSRIESAASRDEVVDALLALCLHHFRRVIFFIVREPWILGWNGLGEGIDRHTAASFKIPLDQPSVFRIVTRDKTIFIGRLGQEAENQRFLKTLGKRPSATAALFPIAVRGRVVNLVYGDGGASGAVKANMGELLVIVQKVARAYLRIIRRRIAETRRELRESGRGDSGADEIDTNQETS
ncbi:MAG: hypothetical protein JXO72_08435 [Vicinamibacteria bacterium]|nr:hypothetical protein [Vicinamibacteria bacterium]